MTKPWIGVSLAVLSALLIAPPRSAHAQCGTASASMTLTDGASYTWDALLDGSINNGSIDAFDGGMVLYVDGVIFPPVTAATTELAGRQLVHGPQTMSGLSVTRRVYVPSTDGWARFLESFDNPTLAPITVSVRIDTNVGSDSGTNITGSASGDTIFTTADRWVTTDDTSGSGDPSLCHALWGTGASATPAMASTTVFSCAGTEGVSVTYSLTVPAGGRAIVLHFGSQHADSASSMTMCTTLSSLPAGTVADLSAADRAAIVNWGAGGTPGLPLGSACTSASQCTSGNCVDSVCCNEACGGGSVDCQACSIAAGGSTNGMCTTIASCCTSSLDCDDGDVCTSDTCLSGTCTHTPITGCGEVDAGMRDAGMRDAGTTERDAGPGFDAGPLPDGSVIRRDGGSTTDAGLVRRGGRRGGCGCAVPGDPTSGFGALALGALLAIAIWRRRRRGP